MTERWTVIHDELMNCYSVCDGEETIGDLFYAEGVTDDQEQQRAKAYLVASAPLLLEALERVNQALRPKYQGEAIFVTITLKPADVEAIREALRIARGGRA